MLPLVISVAGLVYSDSVLSGSHIEELSLMLSKQFRITLNWATVMLLNCAFISSSVWLFLPNDWKAPLLSVAAGFASSVCSALFEARIDQLQ
jgi:hypothetical protein